MRYVVGFVFGLLVGAFAAFSTQAVQAQLAEGRPLPGRAGPDEAELALAAKLAAMGVPDASG